MRLELAARKVVLVFAFAAIQKSVPTTELRKRHLLDDHFTAIGVDQFDDQPTIIYIRTWREHPPAMPQPKPQHYRRNQIDEPLRIRVLRQMPRPGEYKIDKDKQV